MPSGIKPFRDLIGAPPWELAALPLRRVKVAVLDSGIDGSHEALRGRVFRATAWKKAPDGTPCPEPLAPRANNDPAGHGTGVAGVIAAMAPNARIEDVRVLDADAAGFGSVVLAGLRAAVEGDAEVINVSIAIEKNRWWREAAELLEEAYLRGKIVVASKRNFPRPDDLGIPAELSDAVSVDSFPFASPWFLRYFASSPIEFAANGENVLTARTGGGWTRLTGTSFATPTISALCTLLRGANSDLALFEIKSILKHWSDRFCAVPAGNSKRRGRAVCPSNAPEMPPNPLETAPQTASHADHWFLVEWTCPHCGAKSLVPDAFPTVQCRQCGRTSRRDPLLDPRTCFNVLEEIRSMTSGRFSFHNATHAKDAVAACYEIFRREPRLPDARKREILLAALVHDYSYADNPDRHEEASAEVARDIAHAYGHSERFANAVASLIMATRPNFVPTTLPQKIIRCADLFHVGSPMWRKRSALLRQEISSVTGKKVSDHEWARREIEFLSRHRFPLAWLERERRPEIEAEIRRLSRLANKSKRTGP